MKIKQIVLITAIVFSMSFTVMADVRPASLFSDNMVIQRPNAGFHLGVGRCG